MILVPTRAEAFVLVPQPHHRGLLSMILKLVIWMFPKDQAKYLVLFQFNDGVRQNIHLKKYVLWQNSHEHVM